MRVIGLGRRIRGRIGLGLVMRTGATLAVTGTETVDGLNMSTAGTATGAGTLTASGITTTASWDVASKPASTP